MRGVGTNPRLGALFFLDGREKDALSLKKRTCDRRLCKKQKVNVCFWQVLIKSVRSVYTSLHKLRLYLKQLEFQHVPGNIDNNSEKY